MPLFFPHKFVQKSAPYTQQNKVYHTVIDTQAQKYVRRWNWYTQSDPTLVFPGTIMRENLSSPILARCYRWEDGAYKRKSKFLISTLAGNPGEVCQTAWRTLKGKLNLGETFPGTSKSTGELKIKPLYLRRGTAVLYHIGEIHSFWGKMENKKSAQINLNSFSILYLYLNHPYVFIVIPSEDPKNHLFF